MYFSYISFILFLKNTFLSSYSHWVYIVIDTSLYLYTLPIDYLFLSYLSLCLSCNLIQA